MKMQLMALACAALLAGCGKDDNGTLRMVTEPTFPPYEFLRGQEVVGIDVELCRAIAAKLGRKLEVVSLDFDAVIPSLVSGGPFQIVPALTITEDRKKNVDFSVPYERAGLVIVFLKKSPIETAEACKGKRIGVQGGTTYDEYVVNDLKQEPERYRSTPEAVLALKAGRCDAVICDHIIGENCVVGESDLAISDYITCEDFAIAIRKGQPEFLAAINETIAELKANGTLKKWTADFTAEAERMKEK